MSSLVILGWVAASSGMFERILNPDVGSLATNALRLGAYFACGMLLSAFAERLRIRWWAVVASAGVYVVASEFGADIGIPARLSQLLMVPSLAFAVLGTAALVRTKICARNDISYGVYVYAFPVQQLLVVAGITRFGWSATVAACVVCTAPLALASWLLIERRALSAKRLVKATAWSECPSPAAARAAGIAD